MRIVRGFGRFIWDLLIGETPGITAGVATLVVALGVSDLLDVSVPYLFAPLVVVVTLFFSLRHQLKGTSK